MNKFNKMNFWLAAIISVFLFTGFASAKVTYAKYGMIADGLTDQIRKDLSAKDLTVEITRASDLEISNGKQALFGDAYYVLKNERTPIYFEVVINTVKNKVASVDYTFVENESRVSESFLQKLIIKKLGTDYKTKEIMISIDNLKKIDQTNGIEKYRGTGEVRIGSFVMNKIKFEVSLNGESEQIIYKLYEM